MSEHERSYGCFPGDRRPVMRLPGGRPNIGIMEKKMETAILIYSGCIGVIWG